MEYQYNKSDLIKNPQKYQKTPFLGNDFLIIYKKSRQEIIKKTTIKEDKKNIAIFKPNENIKDILNKEQFELEELLNEILNFKKNRKEMDSKNDFIIDNLLKKFEIKKRISKKYNSNLKEMDKEYNYLQNYLLLSKLGFIRYNETNNLRFFNTVLKINDTLCSQIEKFKTDSEKILLNYLLKNELDIINHICITNGIEF